jgi:hypothetical protein
LVLYIIRGLPGAGKSTLANRLADWVISADDHFVVDGEYKFDPTKLPEAHANCYNRTKNALERVCVELSAPGFRTGFSTSVAVANVFALKEHVAPYAKLGREMGAKVFVLDLFDQNMSDERLAASSIHGVPVETIRAMRLAWEH